MTLDARPAVAFVTLGCPKNEVDTDRMRAALSAASFRIVDDPENADAVVVNTCSFIRDATEESVQVVMDLAAERLGSSVERKLVVAGCMPSRYGDDLTAAMPEVDAFVPVADETSLPDIIARLTGVEVLTPGDGAPVRTSSGASAYLQIADGCHRSCAYCTIPAIRGPYRSRSLDEIVAEARLLVSQGAREIILIGQDTTSYGHDRTDGHTLADVVDAVASLDGVAWLRLMYAQPDGVDDALLAAMARHDNVCRYLDMPLQHSHSRILKAMGRRGDGDGYLRLLERIRSALPGVVLRTTLIAGFPGETRAEAAQLLDFVAQARFDYVGVFPYSPEEGTRAALMADQVPRRTRIARAQRVRDLADVIGFEQAGERVGEVLEVLVEGADEDDGVVFGRMRGQAPEIDGVVLLDKGEPGEILSVRIVDSLGYDLEGEVV